MKVKKYIKKYGMKIWAIVFLIVEFYIKNFIEETDGKNAFFTKEYEAFKILVITILLVINIISMLNKNINGKKFLIKIVIIIYIILLTGLHIPGLSIAIMKGEDIEYLNGYGYANLEHEVPVGINSVFELCSISKQFTVATIMLLIENGKLTLNDSIEKYLPSLPHLWCDITILHLLTATSGIKDYINELQLNEHKSKVRINKY